MKQHNRSKQKNHNRKPHTTNNNTKYNNNNNNRPRARSLCGPQEQRNLQPQPINTISNKTNQTKHRKLRNRKHSGNAHFGATHVWHTHSGDVFQRYLFEKLESNCRPQPESTPLNTKPGQLRKTQHEATETNCKRCAQPAGKIDSEMPRQSSESLQEVPEEAPGSPEG